MSEHENWNDDYQDDIEANGRPIIRLGQSNSPKVIEGALGIGDWLMANGLAAKGCYRFYAIGCEELHVHWGANRSGLLGFSPETPPGTDWLKPGVPREGYPSVLKEGRYAPDGSLWEHTVYLHQLVVAVGQPAVRLDQPICGTFPFRSKALKIGQDFYHSQLKQIEAVIDGRRARNMALGLCEMRSELAHGRNQYAWMTPKPIVIGVVGQPGGPSIEEARYAKTLRDSFKKGQMWASTPLPAIAAPSSSAEPARIPASERGTPKPDIRSGRDAWKSDPPPIPPDAYDGNAGGPHSLDEAIFD